MICERADHITNKKIPEIPRGFFVSVSQLANDDDIAGLQTLGSLFDIELDLLALLQVLVTISLDG